MKSKIMIRTGLLLLAAAFLIAGYNIWDEYRASKNTDDVMAQLETLTGDNKKLYEIYPDMEMPELEIDGRRYIGVLSIPSLDLDLPVLSAWDDENLKIAPCRYMGSAYSGNMILSGHNYKCHFSGIKTLVYGDGILFTDILGNVFEYEVSNLEILEDTAVEEMEAGEWDLTLFTCTYSGRDRVTVRCILKEN